MWSVQIQCEDYQRLINRNWRRSGHYIYKPNSIKTCCSMYTIKSDVLDFKLNKSHKKVIKRMNKFLKDGIHDKNPQSKESNSESCNEASELFSKRSKNKIDGQSLTNALPTSRSQNDDESGTSSTDCKPKNGELSTEVMYLVNFDSLQICLSVIKRNLKKLLKMKMLWLTLINRIVKRLN